MNLLNAINPFKWIGDAVTSVTKTLTHKKNKLADAEAYVSQKGADAMMSQVNSKNEQLLKATGTGMAAFVTVLVLSPLLVQAIAVFVGSLAVSWQYINSEWTVADYLTSLTAVGNHFVVAIQNIDAQYYQLMELVIYTAVGATSLLGGTKFVARKKQQNAVNNALQGLKTLEKQTPNEKVVESSLHEVTAEVLPHLIKSEGKVLGLYVDSENLLTMGVGTLVSTTEVPENVKAWIKEAKYTFDNDEVRMLAIQRIDEKRCNLQKIDFYKNSNQATKCILVRLSFWLGVEGLMNFKNFIKALKAHNFDEAAKELMDSRIGRGEQGAGVQKRMQRICDELLSVN